MSSFWHQWSIFIVFTAMVGISKQSPLKDETEPYCSPPPNPTKTHYLIGYGSLLNQASLLRTYPDTGEPIPVTINGFSRHWNARSGGVRLGITYLGAVESPSSSFNGIVFEIKSTDIGATLLEFDKREEWYCRHRVQLNQLNFTAWNSSLNDVLEDGEFWLYVNKPEHTDMPSKEFPIVQSYIDIFLTGCLEVEAKFGLKDYAKQCISTTHDWGFHWVNDRIYRRRPFVFVPKASKIDALLAASVPKEYFSIVIE